MLYSQLRNKRALTMKTLTIDKKGAITRGIKCIATEPGGDQFVQLHTQTRPLQLARGYTYKKDQPEVIKDFIYDANCIDVGGSLFFTAQQSGERDLLLILLKRRAYKRMNGWVKTIYHPKNIAYTVILATEGSIIEIPIDPDEDASDDDEVVWKKIEIILPA
ncbi:hypothetical protein A3J61_00390 [Candidatus Nomurabacteria bacterium RIFCSPHIGHO2_02_FULL_38_15]|uniref:Uncharacterized protein n=1 Tax=Candidatus Nomurabacteria bacterium RIFCSPHIGHO2_02_FULL_38_15 TaxID=1801752 RepID=A0A1F6VRX2_9BACT|nr:MAG: hypothetical protein A3J61_00390 [Candidatus Nomurabacteria bacterium RIFCSPHIGHO2_02_FULL_38_15]